MRPLLRYKITNFSSNKQTFSALFDDKNIFFCCKTFICGLCLRCLRIASERQSPINTTSVTLSEATEAKKLKIIHEVFCNNSSLTPTFPPHRGGVRGGLSKLTATASDFTATAWKLKPTALTTKADFIEIKADFVGTKADFVETKATLTNARATLDFLRARLDFVRSRLNFVRSALVSTSSRLKSERAH